MTFTLWANKTGSKCPSLCPFCFEYGRLGFTVLHGFKKKNLSVSEFRLIVSHICRHSSAKYGQQSTKSSRVLL